MDTFRSFPATDLTKKISTQHTQHQQETQLVYQYHKYYKQSFMGGQANFKVSLSVGPVSLFLGISNRREILYVLDAPTDPHGFSPL